MEHNTALVQLTLDPGLKDREKSIAKAVLEGQRISTDDAQFLFEQDNLPYLSLLSDFVRKEKNGFATYFNRNFHIEPTNICIYDCKFCSYSRKIKKRSEGWEYTADDMMKIVKSYDGKPVTEVHIVGGVLPQYDLEFYEDLFRQIKAHRPELHIKALTPVEFHYIFKKAKVDYLTGMKRLIAAGLDSVPGGGAEIFDEEIRAEISGDKCKSDEWIELHHILHDLGHRSNATILYGHIETYAHRVDHLDRLRKLQDETAGFQAFIPLKFRNENNEMSHLPETTVIEDLKMYAISRIFLDNFQHIKAYWPMIGRDTTQLSLSFGVDDIDGTIDDTTKIYSMAGSEEKNPAMTTPELIDLISRASYKPIERDTLYNVLHDFSLEEFVLEGESELSK